MDGHSHEEIAKWSLRKLGIENEVRVSAGRGPRETNKSKNAKEGSREDHVGRKSRSGKGESKEDRKGPDWVIK